MMVEAEAGALWPQVLEDAKKGLPCKGRAALREVCDLLEIRLWISGVQNPELLLVTH